MIDVSVRQREKLRLEALAVERDIEAQRNTTRLNRVLIPVLGIFLVVFWTAVGVGLYERSQSEASQNQGVTK